MDEQTDYTVPNPWIMVKSVATTYSTANTYSSSYHTTRTFPYVSAVVTTANDLYGSQMPTTTQTFTPDGYGNDTGATSSVVEDYGNINTVYNTTDTYAYQDDLLGWTPTSGNWIIGRLTSKQLVASYTDNNNSANSSAAITRLTTYTVDENTGFTTLATRQPGTYYPSFNLSTNFQYDSFGNRVSAKSSGYGGTRVDQWSYTANPTADPGHAFPDTATNALTQGSSATYDLRWGLPLTATDIDGRVTTYTYDDLGRETTEILPDGSKVTTSYMFCQGVNGGTLAGCPTGAQYAVQVIDMGADGSNQMSPTKIAYYDTLDREIFADTQTFSGGLSRVAQTYNTQLQLASVTRPYVPGATTQATTTYAYDALNRVTQTNYPDSSFDTTIYSSTNKSITIGRTSSYTGQNIYKIYDGRGNLTNVIQGVTEGTNFTNLFSEYYYDGFNDLLKYNDPAGNLTLYTYDLLGRKTQITDPDAGTRSQSYNSFDEMLTVQDGKSNLASMTYDALGRMTLRCWTNNNPNDAQTCPNPSGTEVKETWSYDPANGIGEVAGETSSHGKGYEAVHTYNSASPTKGLLGQPATSTITIGTQNFAYSYGYDDNNRPFYYNAPSGALPITTHNAYSYINTLVDGYGGPIVWQANTRDVEGHLTSASFGNGTNPVYVYDPNTGRITGLATHSSVGANAAIQWVGYTWDQLGNLTQRNDIINGLVENYAYDELNRLTGITLPNNGNASENSFTYDLLGNMLTKADVGTYTYPPAGQAQPHGVSSISGSGGTTSVVYDSDGNMATETGATLRTVTWTMFNMPASITYNNKLTTFQYDADHNRVMQKAPEGTTYYLPDGELTPSTGSGPMWHTYFEVDGQRVAEDYGPTGALAHHYFHNDYQNTIGLVTDDTFNINNYPTGIWNDQNEGSDVFGQPRSVNGAIDMTWGASDVTKRRWINQEDLTDAHLIDLNARVFDPLLGKFMSPDPIIADQDDSQSWNAYAYSHNNPMSKEDPTGLDDECNAGCLYFTGSSGAGGAWAKAHTGPQFGIRTGATTQAVTAQQAQDAISKGSTASQEVLNAVNSATGGLLPTPVREEKIISPSGGDFIKGFEHGPHGGYAAVPYNSLEGGSQTVGWGHKIQPGESFTSGITRQQADTLFDSDIRPSEIDVNRKVTTPLAQGQFDALTSLRYNTGPRGFTATRVPQLLNQGKNQEAMDAWANINHLAGSETPMRGLTIRRSEEITTFQQAVPGQ